MLFSSAIKNSIIILLSILIVNFIVKSIISDRCGMSIDDDMSKNNDTFFTHTHSENSGMMYGESDPIEQLPHSTVSASPSDEDLFEQIALIDSADPNPPRSKPKSDDMDDDLYAHVFGNDKEEEAPKTKPVKKVSFELPSSTEEESIPQLVINHYAKENSMNGGEIFGSLKGYDSFTSEYSMI